MRNHTRVAAAMLLAAFTFTAALHAAEPEMTVASRATITIDGNPADWKGVPLQSPDDRPWTMGVARDDESLYALLRFSDLDLADTVLRSGTILWVSGGGKHTPGFGLRYRGTKALQRGVQELQKAQAPAESLATASAAPGQRSGRAQPVRPPLGTLEVLRNATVNEIINDGLQPAGVAAASRLNGTELVYEFRVPLAEIATPPATPGAAAVVPERVAVGFQLSGATPAERAEARARRRGPGASPWASPPAGQPGTGDVASAQIAPAGAATAAQPATGSSRRSRSGDATATGQATASTGAAAQKAADPSAPRLRRGGTEWLDVTLAAPPEQEAAAPATP